MNFAGIAVLTEPDASRAASYNWVHYVHRGESRRHASAGGNYRNLSSAVALPLREEGSRLGFSVGRARPGHRARIARYTLRPLLVLLPVLLPLLLASVA